MELLINKSVDMVFNTFGTMNQSVEPVLKNVSFAISAKNTQVEALYPCKKVQNSFTVKRNSHVKELKEQRETARARAKKAVKVCVDYRECAIIRDAQAAEGMFRRRV